MIPRAAAALVVGLLLAPYALAQAVSEWRTRGGVPVAVVELAGGDVEHLVALVPVTATAPPTITGWPVGVTTRPGAVTWSLAVPEVVAAQAVIDFANALAATPCAAVVAAGPVAARDLSGPLAGLDAVPAAASLPPSCVLADGGIDSVRGSPERVDLYLAAPQPSDPRFETLDVLAAVLERRLAATVPAVRAGVELRTGCWRLAVHLPAEADGARVVLRRLRDAIAGAARDPVTESEVNAATAALRREAAARLGEGGALAIQIAERLAQGGRAAGALTATLPGPAALTEALRAELVGRAGFAVLTETERRARPDEPETLPNGVILTPRWLGDEVGVLALAIGAIDPEVGRQVTISLATALSSGGWHASTGEVGGVPILAATLPPDDVPAALEIIGDALGSAPAPAAPSLGSLAADALGLRKVITGESISVALALPPEADEGLEAARKFLSGIASGGVRSSAPATGPHLAWTPAEPPPRLAALVDLPATAAGWFAGEVLAARGEREGGTHGAWMSPVGSLALVLLGEGEAHVPALDATLAAAWPRLRRAPDQAELAAAAQRLFARLYGDLPAATARTAARPFLAGVPDETELLAPDAAAVGAVLAALPAWDALRRIALGPAPAVVSPPVRKSPRR